MSQNSNVEISQIEEAEYDEYSRDDFGFVIGPDGELKSIMYPEHLMDDPPEEIKLILQIFGIDNIDTIEDRILH